MTTVGEDSPDGSSAHTNDVPAPRPHWADWRFFVAFSVNILSFQAIWVVLGVLSYLSCEETNYPPEMNWLRIAGGCLVHVEGFRNGMLLFLAFVLFVDTITPGLTVYLIRTQLDPSKWRALTMFKEQPTLSVISYAFAFMAIEVGCALAFTALGPIGLAVGVLLSYFVSQMVQGWTLSIWMPATDLPELVAHLPHLFGLLPTLQNVAASFDNATDLATALVLNPDFTIGLLYIIFAFLSLIHHVISLAFASTEFRRKVNQASSHYTRTVHPSSPSPQASSSTSTGVPEAIRALRLWTAWKIVGVILTEFPLLTLDFILLASGQSKLLIPGAEETTVVIVGAIAKGASLLSNIVQIIWHVRTLCLLPKM